ncbi:MAG: hypothetical protein AAGA41_05605 [Pseudomonadota bacterium]
MSVPAPAVDRDARARRWLHRAFAALGLALAAPLITWVVVWQFYAGSGTWDQLGDVLTVYVMGFGAGGLLALAALIMASVAAWHRPSVLLWVVPLGALIAFAVYWFLDSRITALTG